MRPEQLEIVRQDCAVAGAGLGAALDPLRGAHLLMTGGTGFVGTWLTEMIAFLNDTRAFNTRLTLLARNTDRFGAAAPHLAARPDVSLVSADVRDVRDIPADVTWVVHAGATPDSRMHTSDPLKTADVIVGGTRAVLEAAVRLPRLDGFLNLSSGLVYGAQPLDIEHLPEGRFGGLDCGAFTALYAESKRMAETYCAAFGNRYRIRIVHARPFAFIGPYQFLDRPWAINNFIRDSLLGGPIRILGDGETVRSYMYPADMAAWLLTILVQGQPGASYNVGSPHGLALRAVAEAVAEQFPNAPRIVSSLSSAKHTGRTRFVPDVTRTQELLGLALKFDFHTAVRRTVQWNTSASASGRLG